MSKEYKFNGKAYIAKKENCGCKDCAFDREDADICRKFFSTKGVPHCSRHNIIFVEKPEATITKSQRGKAIDSVKVFATKLSNESIALLHKESSQGVKPENKTEISCFIVCLTENCKLAPADVPKIHSTRESAEKEAERLCKLHHQEFVVLQVVSSVRPQESKKEVFA